MMDASSGLVCRRELGTRIAALEASLLPAPQSVVGDRMKILHASFPSRDRGGDGEALRARAYLFALDGVPEGALDAAIQDVLTGRAPEIDPAFLPTPAQLARLCRLKAAEIRTELRRLQEAARPPPEPEPEVSEEEYARRREQVTALLGPLRAKQVLRQCPSGRQDQRGRARSRPKSMERRNERVAKPGGNT